MLPEEVAVSRSRMLRFVVLQGLPEPAPHACALHYDALILQPRLVAVLVAAAAVAREPVAWAGIAGLLLLGAAAPRLNPFDALYAALSRRRSRRVFLPAARAPRRFAQAVAALLCLTAAAGLLRGHEAVAWGVVAALGAAFAGIFGFGFCFGSWLFRLLVPSWRPPQERPAPSSTAGVPKVTGTASGDELRTPPRTPHASSPSSQPLAGIPADRV